MTQNNRIIFNVLTTYGRSVLALLCGLFTSRWVLSALGVEAFGVYGVIGVVIAFVTIVNEILSVSVSRYYAFAVGKGMGGSSEAEVNEDCKSWFNVALLIHTVLPLLFVVVALIVGEWAIENYFNIPYQFRPASHWVLYFSLITALVGFVTTPFRAFYIANQLIAELTLYVMLVPIFNLLCAWVLLSYNGDRLFFHALYMMLLSVVPSLIIMVRAFFVFPACRVDFSRMLDRAKFHELFSFAGWQAVGWLGFTARAQGAALIVNRLLGISYNSTMSIGNTVAGHASTLSNALTGAFTPAVANAAGAADAKEVYKLSLRCSKFSTILCALFVLPLSVEIDYLISIWLKTIPPMVGSVCVIMLVGMLVDRLGSGAMTAIIASGNIKLHELLSFAIYLFSVAVAYVFVRFLHFGVVGVAAAMLLSLVLVNGMRVALWHFQLGNQIREWLLQLLLPFVLVTACSVVASCLWRYIMEASFVRLLLSSFTAVIISMGGFFLCVLTHSERTYCVDRFKFLLNKARGD